MARRLTVLVALLAVFTMPALSEASTVTITDYNLGNSDFFNNAAGDGGPYGAHTTGTALGVANFVTFCIEYNEFLSRDVTYNFDLSDNAVNGGVAGGNPDPLSDATKWLYYQVATGGYASQYTAATGLAVSNDVGARFQDAFWFLEQERTAAETGGTSSAGYLLAQHALAHQNWSTLYAGGNRVYAMNLTDDGGGFHQDLLAYQSVPVPTPEPGSLVLLGSGLVYAAGKLRRWKWSK